MGNNGEKVKKMCPFLGKWCIEDACNLYIGVTQQGVNTLGVRTVTQAGACVFPALAMIMSNKPQLPSVPIKLPGILRG